MKNSHHLYSTSLMALLTAVVLAGCGDESKKPTVASQETKLSLEESLQQIENKNDGAVAEGIRHLVAHEYKEASRVFNVALMDDAGNPALNYLNGLTYHLMAENGLKGNYEVAAIGYQRAIEADPAYWPAMLQLGRLFAKEKKFKEAQDLFANVLLIRPNHAEAMHELAMASYYAYDLPHASQYIQGALKQQPNNTGFHRSAAIIFAAVGDHQKANTHLQQYSKSGLEKNDITLVSQRVQDWKRVHENGELYLAAGTAPEVEELSIKHDEFQKMDTSGGAQAAGAMPGQPAGAPNQPGAAPEQQAAAQPPKAKEPPMITMDGVVMRVSENGTTNKGFNLLDAFSKTILSFGQLKTTTNTENGGVHTAEGKTFITKGFSLAGTQSSLGSGGNITYSLNIANVNRNYIEVIAKPTLVTSVGSEAKFFAGTELTFGLQGSSGGSGTFVKYPVGIALQVTPTKLEGNTITMNVVLTGDTILGLAENPTTAYTSVGHSYVSTSVRAKLGETIVVGGIMHSTDTSTTSKTPGLGEVPVLQYAFRNDSTDSERKWVMYLITPREYTGHETDGTKAKAKKAKHVVTPNLKELDMRSQDWHMTPTIPTIFEGLEPTHRCFRYGDVKPVNWSAPEPIERSLEEFVQFIWL